MKEHPILFSSDMVQAILDGRKTMTRRVFKSGVKISQLATPEQWNAGKANDKMPDFETWGPRRGFILAETETGSIVAIPCPYGQPGDQLWVRETFSRCGCDACLKAWPKQGKHEVTYVADYAGPSGIVVKPSIFMPRWASRITLEIIEVRVERLQEISQKDAWEEGCHVPNPIAGFMLLWDSINGKKYPWASNPWVWVIYFKQNELPEVHK